MENYTKSVSNDDTTALVAFDGTWQIENLQEIFTNQPHITSTSISPPGREEPKFYFTICQCDNAACELRFGEPGEVAIYLFRESSSKEEETIRWSVSIQGLYEVKSEPRGIPVYTLIELFGIYFCLIVTVYRKKFTSTLNHYGGKLMSREELLNPANGWIFENDTLRLHWKVIQSHKF